MCQSRPLSFETRGKTSPQGRNGKLGATWFAVSCSKANIINLYDNVCETNAYFWALFQGTRAKPKARLSLEMTRGQCSTLQANLGVDQYSWPPNDHGPFDQPMFISFLARPD